MRTVSWFSAGAASARATALALEQDPLTVVAYCDPGGEHPDNNRFIKDVERFLQIETVRLKNRLFSWVI